MADSPTLLAAYPWEQIRNEIRVWNFTIFNYDPKRFCPTKVSAIASVLERFLKKYFQPIWRVAAAIEVFNPPSEQAIVDNSLDKVITYANPDRTTGSYIPIYLVRKIRGSLPSLHGCVSGSVMNGPDALTYLDFPIHDINPLPYGTPFIIISAKAIRRSLSRLLSQHVMAVLADPSGLRSVGTGDPLANEKAGESTVDEPKRQIFYYKNVTAPVSQGDDNIFVYRNYHLSNFVFPAYFFPHNRSDPRSKLQFRSGIYDFLGHVRSPFIPYKGRQFFVSQQENAEVVCGNLISYRSNPRRIISVINGSIYDYASWGLSIEPSVVTASIDTDADDKFSKITCSCPHTVNECEIIGIGHSYSDTTADKRLRKQRINRCGLYPFQYLDGVYIVTRFVLINYIPDLLPPKEVKRTIRPMEHYINEQFARYWSLKVEIVGSYTYPDLPNFDGSFIPFFYLANKMIKPDGVGYYMVNGGGTNVNNVRNILAGPLIGEYFYDAPRLPRGNPYMMSSEGNYRAEIPLSERLQRFTFVTTHELLELSADPTYADYISTSNPPVDRAIIFSQVETADAVERTGYLKPSYGNAGIIVKGRQRLYRMAPYLRPSYFIASLKDSLYDNVGLTQRPLIPPANRQQVVMQSEGSNFQVGNVIFRSAAAIQFNKEYIATLTPKQQSQYASILSYLIPNSLWYLNRGDIFDRDTFYPNDRITYYDSGNFLPIVEYNVSPIGIPIADSPWASIYAGLLENKFIYR